MSVCGPSLLAPVVNHKDLGYLILVEEWRRQCDCIFQGQSDLSQFFRTKITTGKAFLWWLLGPSMIFFFPYYETVYGFPFVCLIVTCNLPICLVRSVRPEVEKGSEQQREKDVKWPCQESWNIEGGAWRNYTSVIGSSVSVLKDAHQQFCKNSFRASPINVCKISSPYQYVHYSGERMCCFQQRFKVNWKKRCWE